VIILSQHQPKILMPIPRHHWREPSCALQKDCFGNQNRTIFNIQAFRKGKVIWHGRFDDREDFDVFLHAIAYDYLRYDRCIQRLPAPWWPGLDEEVGYYYFVNVFIVSTSASNQTDSVPADWNNSSNNIDVIASGASGGAAILNANVAIGGGGGGWSRQTNVTLTPSGTATFFLNVGGAAVTSGSGHVGPDAWYNGATLAGASVGAKGGSAGAAGASPQSASSGGAAASGVGSTKFSGGGGGSATATVGVSGTGGGGAAGLHGNGGNSANGSANYTAGGTGDSGNTAAGANGTQYDATHGSGGGGTGQITAGAGGNYGAGGGGGANTGSATSGAGKQGLIVKQYTPVIPLGISNTTFILQPYDAVRRSVVGY